MNASIRLPWPTRPGGGAPRSRGAQRGGNHLRVLGWALLFWGVVGALRFAGMMIWVLAARQEIDLRSMGDLILPRTIFWAFLTVFLVSVARNLRGSPAAMARRLALLFPVALLAHAMLAAIEQVFRLWIWPIRTDPIGFAVLHNAIPDTVQFFGVILVAKGLEWYRRYRNHRRRAARLGRQLAEAQLELLRMQLQPHFLFNSLQAISELVHVDPHRADRAIVAMGELLRHGLSNGNRALLTLEEELSLLEAYVGIERIRLGAGLQLVTRVPAALLRAGVPNSLLQPIVENAIHHGLRGRAAGRIEVTASRAEGTLEIQVDDDGAGLPPQARRPGNGLRITASRLEKLFGAEAGVELLPRPGGGTRARLWWPALRVAPDARQPVATGPAGCP